MLENLKSYIRNIKKLMIPNQKISHEKIVGIKKYKKESIEKLQI